MKEIQLTQGKVTMVDDEDYDELMKFKWYAYKSKGRYRTIFYAGRNKRKSDTIKFCAMHIIIMGDMPDGYFVDHIDGDGLNNQRHNLRLATKSQNGCNCNSTPNTSSKFKGVSLYSNCHLFSSELTLNRIKIKIGYFKNELEAAIAYDFVALKYHGEFAKTNFTNDELLQFELEKYKYPKVFEKIEKAYKLHTP